MGGEDVAAALVGIIREDDVGVLTLSSHARNRLSGRKNLREDDVGTLTLSSCAGNKRNGSLVALVLGVSGADPPVVWRRSSASLARVRKI